MIDEVYFTGLRLELVDSFLLVVLEPLGIDRGSALDDQEVLVCTLTSEDLN